MILVKYTNTKVHNQFVPYHSKLKHYKRYYYQLNRTNIHGKVSKHFNWTTTVRAILVVDNDGIVRISGSTALRRVLWPENANECCALEILAMPSFLTRIMASTTYTTIRTHNRANIRNLHAVMLSSLRSVVFKVACLSSSSALVETIRKD